MQEKKTLVFDDPSVAALNRVPGFDPKKFLQRTKDGRYVLELKLKKLWFRLKHPNGRIRVNALRLTDQIAVIEAKVYFDKTDNEPVSSFVAQRTAAGPLSSLYIEAAQHAAVDAALNDAGFGLQFEAANKSHEIPVTEVNEPVPAGQPAEAVQTEAVIQAVEKSELPQSVNETETLPLPEEFLVQPEAAEEKHKPCDVPAPQQEALPAQPESQPDFSAAAEIPSAEIPAQQVPAEHTTAPESVIEEQAAPEASVSRFSPDMPVDTIYSLMSVEEAEAVIVDSGVCKGWTLREVAQKRPPSLKFYVNGLGNVSNLLRAGAMRLLESTEAKAS